MAQPFEALLQFFQSLFGRNNHLPFHVNVPVIIFCNYSSTLEYSTPSLGHTILTSIIPTLVGFLQIQCAGSGKNDQQPPHYSIATTMTFVFSVLFYHLASRARHWFPNYASQLGIAMVIAPSVSVAALVSLILPNSWWPLRYTLYVLLVVAELHQVLKRMFDKYVGGLFQLRRRPWWRMISSQEPLLPETHMDTRAHHPGNGNPYQRTWSRSMITAGPVRSVATANLAQVIAV